MRRYSWKFWLCIPLATAFLGGALFLIVSGILLTRGYARERKVPLAVFECDLSKPGTHDIPVTVEYPAGHGFKIIVDGPPQTSTNWEPEPWLAELSGSARILHGPYGETEPRTLLDSFSWFASGPDSRGIVRVYGSAPGQYTLRLIIDSGAPALANVEHRIVIYNDVCGCEIMGTFFGYAIGLFAAVVGAGFAWFGIAKRRTTPTAPHSA